MIRSIVFTILILSAGLGGWLLRANYAGRVAAANAKRMEAAAIESAAGHVRGIGKLQPADGIINIYAPQGQRIDSLYSLQVGDVVEQDQPIVRLAGIQLRQLELEMAQAKKADAINQLSLEDSKSQMKKKAAQLSIDQADAAREEIEAQAKRISLLRIQLEAESEQLKRLKRIKDNPLTSTMVGEVDLDKQSLLVKKIESDLEVAERQAQLGREKAERAQKAAKLELETIELISNEAEKAAPLNSIEAAIKAAEKGVELMELKAPAQGKILDIIVKPGDTATNQPVMVLGDTANMICVAEINDNHMSDVTLGAPVKLKSVALPQPLEGKVVSIGTMIGPPSLKDPNPFANVDRKTGQVIIALNDVSNAGRMVNLQVEVEIEQVDTK